MTESHKEYPGPKKMTWLTSSLALVTEYILQKEGVCNMVREPDINKSALVIVDMQNDCIHPDGYFGWVSRQPGYEDRELAPKGLVANVKKLSESLRNAGRPVVYLQVLFEPDYSDACITYWKKPFWQEKGCYIKDTWGAQIIDELTPQSGDTVLIKKGYSGFQTAPLDEFLKITA